MLTPGGHLIFRVNPVRDFDHGAGRGTPVGHHLYETEDDTLKRFFDEEDVMAFSREFDIEYRREETMTRYLPEKRLFRACVRKAVGSSVRYPYAADGTETASGLAEAEDVREKNGGT